MTVDVIDEQTGEITEALDTAAARDLVDAIRINLEDAADLIEQLWTGRGWIALGYGSWDALVTGEIRGCLPKLERAERKAAVAKLAATGMSERAIAETLQISRNTVANDVAHIEPPAETQGKDGKTYTRKAATPEPTPEQKAETVRLQRNARIYAAMEAISAHLRRLTEEGVGLDPDAFLEPLIAAVRAATTQGDKA